MSDHAQPIFVIGSLRSGASLLALSLGQHPNILPLVDSGWLGFLSRSLQEAYARGVAYRAESQLDLMGIELEDYCAHFGRAVDDLFLRTGDRTAGPGSAALGGAIDPDGPTPPASGPTRARRWVDASPDHSFHVPELLRLFPEAKFVHTLRDADSVVETLVDPAKKPIYRSRFKRMSAEAAYEHWLAHATACVEAERAFGSETVLRLRRDDLVGDPEGSLRRCLAFVDEPFVDACLRPFR